MINKLPFVSSNAIAIACASAVPESMGPTIDQMVASALLRATLPVQDLPDRDILADSKPSLAFVKSEKAPCADTELIDKLP